MSRSGYSDDLDQWSVIKWRGQVASAIRGKRGQTFLRDLLAALDTMTIKRLTSHELVTPDGQVCALGCIGAARGVDLTGVDPEEHKQIGDVFDIAHQLVAEIEFMNDDFWTSETPEQRWVRMRTWVADQLIAGVPA